MLEPLRKGLGVLCPSQPFPLGKGERARGPMGAEPVRLESVEGVGRQSQRPLGTDLKSVAFPEAVGAWGKERDTQLQMLCPLQML